MNKVVVVFLGVFAAVCAFTLESEREWRQFKDTFNKHYPTKTVAEERKHIFLENRRKIAEHNEKYERGEVTYKAGLNKFSDMLPDEIRQLMTGYRDYNATARNPQPGGFEFIQPDVQLPASIDWRKLGAVTKVKDQGNCGSCWAFSATGSLEGQQFLKTGKLVSLSEQNLVDCSSPQGNLGCHGGLMLWAFNYIKENGGIDTEESYPYKGRKNRCKYDPKNSGSTCAGYVFIPRGNVKKLKAALATIGPVSIAIHVGDSFLSYSSGVYIEPNCSTHRLNHGVLAVGYETSKEGHEYLIVKNSWGKSWGEEGYIKMATKDNQCGIASASIYPLV